MTSPSTITRLRELAIHARGLRCILWESSTPRKLRCRLVRLRVERSQPVVSSGSRSPHYSRLRNPSSSLRGHQPRPDSPSSARSQPEAVQGSTSTAPNKSFEDVEVLKGLGLKLALHKTTDGTPARCNSGTSAGVCVVQAAEQGSSEIMHEKDIRRSL